MPDHHEITVGQLATRSGVAVSALHFYEARGLIEARRTAGNQRRHPRVTLRRIAFIRASQRLGIPLSRIKQALDTCLLANPDDMLSVQGPGAHRLHC